MKKTSWIISLLIGFSLCGHQTGIHFEKMDFDAARQKAQNEQKLLLTYFYTDW